jgi:citronellol/citronellal dehydrogenase
MYSSVFRENLFADRVFVVTGGGSGIGRCIAHELASLGAGVALVGRNRDKLESVAKELAPAAVRISIHRCDVRDQEGVIGVVDEVIQQHGRIDGLVNNAGGQFPALLEDITLKGWDAVVRTNLYAPFIVSLACFKAWFKEHGGSIVSVLADFWGSMPAMGHSGAARAGTKSFTETAALEWAASGVRVNAVAPGWIESSGLDTYSESYKAEIARWPALVPLQRLGTVAEVSAAIVFLLSDAAAFITGTTLRVDGGVPNVRPHWPARPGRTTPRYPGFSEPTAGAG